MLIWTGKTGIRGCRCLGNSTAMSFMTCMFRLQVGMRQKSTAHRQDWFRALQPSWRQSLRPGPPLWPGLIGRVRHLKGEQLLRHATLRELKT